MARATDFQPKRRWAAYYRFPMDKLTQVSGTNPKPKKKRRARGDGCVYRKENGRVWYIAYKHPDGRRKVESSRSERRSVAERLLRSRIGAREHHLPVIPRVEQFTFDEAANAVIDDFVANGKKSLVVVRRRIEKHLKPYFGGRRLVGISAMDVTAYVAKRQQDRIFVRREKREKTGELVPAQTKCVSNAEINRELQVLKRIFNLAIESGRIATRPSIKMLREAPARSGFFEPDQYQSVLRHLPEELRPVITFAYVTGWRIKSEVLPLEWRQVDFASGEIRLDAGTTKNGAGRVFPFGQSSVLKALLEQQREEHRQLAKAGQLEPWVFFRMVANERGGAKQPRRIESLTKAWRNACRDAGCPGRIPHDLRRTAVRNLVRAGVSENSAMKLTGHKTRSVFDRYDIVSGSDLADAVRKLDVSAPSRHHPFSNAGLP